MRHAGARFSKQRNLSRVQFHTMRMPDIAPDPAKVLGVLTGSTAEFLKGISNVLFVLSQMGMQHHTFVPRQQSGIAHQIAAD